MNDCAWSNGYRLLAGVVETLPLQRYRQSCEMRGIDKGGELGKICELIV